MSRLTLAVETFIKERLVIADDVTKPADVRERAQKDIEFIYKRVAAIPATLSDDDQWIQWVVISWSLPSASPPPSGIVYATDAATPQPPEPTEDVPTAGEPVFVDIE